MDTIENTRVRVSGNGLWRPAYHFTAPKGWMNDPNGLIFYKGNYHLFYQYNPEGCEWGSMHWGHAISRDMLHWKDLPIALYPDQPYDNHPKGGCFSGSAVEKDGILYLFYSATVKEDTRVRQTQCMAYSRDGVIFEKYEGNPIIKNPPPGASDDFRDPKVFAFNGRWYMVIGGSIGGADSGDGRVFLYVSDDLIHWDYQGNVIESRGQLGTMCECPDMFELNGKWVLICSLMYHPRNIKTLYCVGTMDFEHCGFIIEEMGELDAGFDYYAPQSFTDEKGNRVLIAWQNGWLWMPWCEGWGPTAVEGWRGTLSLPRVISLTRNHQICLTTIDCLDKFMIPDQAEEKVTITKSKYYLHPKNPFSYEISMSGRTEDIESKYLEIGLLSSASHETAINFDFISGIMTFDRSNADQFSTGRKSCIFDKEFGTFDVKLLVDHSSVEVILNDKYCMTSNVYPSKVETDCYIRTPYKKGILSNLAVSTIKSIW